MKRVQMFVLAMLVTAFAFQASALAKMVSGKIDGMDAEMKKLTISITDAVTGAESKADVWVNEGASYSGVAALNELKKGDMIAVEAEQDEKGNWKASTVTKA